MRIARVHPMTLAVRDASNADAFEIEGHDYRIVRSESVPLGEVILVDDECERVARLEPVAN